MGRVAEIRKQLFISRIGTKGQAVANNDISICVLCLLYGVPVSMYSSPGIHRMSAKPVRSIYGDRLNESGFFMLQDLKRHLPDPGDGVF